MAVFFCAYPWHKECLERKLEMPGDVCFVKSWRQRVTFSINFKPHFQSGGKQSCPYPSHHTQCIRLQGLNQEPGHDASPCSQRRGEGVIQTSWQLNHPLKEPLSLCGCREELQLLRCRWGVLRLSDSPPMGAWLSCSLSAPAQPSPCLRLVSGFRCAGWETLHFPWLLVFCQFRCLSWPSKGSGMCQSQHEAREW